MGCLQACKLKAPPEMRELAQEVHFSWKFPIPVAKATCPNGMTCLYKLLRHWDGAAMWHLQQQLELNHQCERWEIHFRPPTSLSATLRHSVPTLTALPSEMKRLSSTHSCNTPLHRAVYSILQCSIAGLRAGYREWDSNKPKFNSQQ